MLDNFKENLTKYAHLLIYKGINVKPGDWVKIYIAVDQVELARELTREAYEAGAAKVIVDWNDDAITRHHYLNQETELLAEVPDYEIAKIESQIGDHKISRLSIVSKDPGALNGIDSSKIQTVQSAYAKAMKRQIDATMSDEIKWTVAAAAGPAWAKLLYPE